MILIQISDKIIKYSFYLLFFLVPLVLTPLNYELFEFNKMIAVYFLTTIILGAWLIKTISQGEIRIQRTPLDFPILLFFIFNFLSFIFSIDRHVSLWGYYSRFHGGFLSTICYIILYYAFVSNITERTHNEKARQNNPNSSLVPTSHGRFFLVQNSLNLREGRKLIFISLASGFLVSFYGILEHFGIDKDIWVQDVQNRVFSTLGQPNWLAAYLCVVLPIAMALSLISKINPSTPLRVDGERSRTIKYQKFLNFALSFCILIFYICILFTKSRSGFLGFWTTNALFTLLTIFVTSSPPKKTISLPSFKKKVTKRHAIAGKNGASRQFFQPRDIWQKLLILNLFFLLITFFIGSPFATVNRYFTFASLTQNFFKKEVPSPPPSLGPALETGGTESGEIRRIVWKGAVDIARHFPLFGTGVETFAFAYYRFRPKEHNLTSEWDFLYNKAHNEYLNYAATTGFLGLGSYLLIILTFIIWFLKTNSKFEALNSKHPEVEQSSLQGSPDTELRSGSGQMPNSNSQNSKQKKFWPFGFRILALGLFSGWLSILVTNFFGFSVVIVATFFWLIPAISFVLAKALDPKKAFIINLPISKPLREAALALILFFIFYFLFFISRLWYADTLFAKGNNLIQTSEDTAAYLYLQKAVSLNPGEPLYHDKLSLNLGDLATLAFLENEATLSATLISSALSHSQKAITTSPQNVNFWKTRTRMFYTLSQIEEKYGQEALNSLLVAKKLAPTDAKIAYNLGLLYAEAGQTEKATKILEETVGLKPNYRDAHFALAIFYDEKGLRQKATDELKYILEKINPEDQEIKDQLEEWKR